MKKSLFILLFLSIYTSSLLAQKDIVALEYFIDTDPGFGVATAVAISATDDLDQNFTIDISGVSSGFHTLYARSQDSDGNWSLISRRSFYKEGIANTVKDIVALEYFIDTDPGFGVATAVAISATDDLDQNFTVDISGVSSGFHTLYARSQDSDGNWSLMATRPFYIDSASVAEKDIVAAEYYFDNDPGFGNGIAIPLPPTDSTALDFAFEMELGCLQIGTHRAYVRTKDSDEDWSLISFDEFELTELPELIVNISADSTVVCVGETIMITASRNGTGTFLWSTTETTASIVVGAGTYTVTATDPGGCTGTSMITITKHPQTVANISADSTIVCGGETLSLTASGGVIYEWSTAETAASIIAGVGNYTVTVTDANGCTDTDMITITKHPPTVANISADSTIVCVGETLSLTASGGVIYEWSTAETAASIIAGVGNYTVTVTDANGCTDTDMITITKHPPTVANISADSTIVCVGETLSLTASGGLMYEWATTETTASIIADVGNYTVTVTDANGCTDSEMITITEHPQIVVNISADSTIVCVGETLSLTASGGVMYEWATTETTASIIADVGNYTVTVTDANGCTDSEMITITEHPQTVANISTDSTIVCVGETLSLTASGGVSYEWSTTETTASIIAGVGNYTVTVTDANGCTDTEMITITEHPPTVANISADSTIVCVGETLSLTASGGVSYEWSTTETTASIILGIGNYTVTVTDVNGCTDTDMITITEHPQTVANISADSTIVCVGETLSLTASGGVSYEWSTTETTASIIVGVGTYTVTVTNANGCTDSEMITITEHPPTNANISADMTSLCFGETAVLTASGGLAYEWSTTETTAAITVDTGTYIVTVTDINGCTDTEMIEITQNTDYAFCDCDGDTLAINDVPIADADYTVTQTISSDGFVPMTGIVTFDAGQSITLKAPFEAENGSLFTARIGGCTPVSSQEVSTNQTTVVESRRSEESISVEKQHIKVFPNPFSIATTIEYELSEIKEVEFHIVNITGRVVTTLVPSQWQEQGKYQIEWLPQQKQAGIYFLRARVGEQWMTRKLMLIE